jgi:hypothetical protein
LSWLSLISLCVLIEQAIRSRGPEAGLNLRVQKLEEEKNYPLLFEVSDIVALLEASERGYRKSGVGRDMMMRCELSRFT